VTGRGGGVSERPERRRRVGVPILLVSVATLVGAATAATVRARSAGADRVLPPLRIAPAVVFAPIALDGALVRGARRDWAIGRPGPVHVGDPVPVELTAYCLQGTTRRDRYVRQGIVAADPKLFPLGRFVELYVGRRYVGRFLVDDTGERIRGSILDIWTPECRDARLFGRRRGTAVLVPRPLGASADTLLTGQLAGPALR
jgi:3D (Asp-Asp-Asp) domain-containing protein